MIINIDEKIEQLVAESLKPLYNKIYNLVDIGNKLKI